LLADIGAADGNGDDLGARSEDGGTRLRKVAIFAGANQQPRRIGFPATRSESAVVMASDQGKGAKQVLKRGAARLRRGRSARLAAADRRDDLEPIAVNERHVVKPAARHDLAVMLDREAFVGEIEFREQLCNIPDLAETARTPVDDKFHQVQIEVDAMKEFYAACCHSQSASDIGRDCQG